jgi:hypothetical protein
LTAFFTSSSLLKRLPPKNSFNFGNKLKSLGASLDYMLDAQTLPSQTLEALLAFWQQHAGAHCRAGESRRLTRGPAVGFELRTVTASELHNKIHHTLP